MKSKGEEDITLRDLLLPLFRYRRTLVISFLVVFVLAWLVSSRVLGEKYQSRMEILVRRDRADPVVSTQPSNASSSPVASVTEEEINSEAELLKSRDVLEKVVSTSGLLQQDSKKSWLSRLFPQPPLSSAARLDHAVLELGKALSIKPILKSDVLEVTYSSSKPSLAFAVLDALRKAYLEKHIDVHGHTSSYAFFAQETDRYQNAMAEDERQLRDLSAERVAAPELAREGVATQMANSLGLLHVAEQAIASDQARVRSDQIYLQETPARAVASQSSAVSTQLVQEAGGQLLKAKTKRADLAMKFSPNYPLVQEANREVELADQAFKDAQEKQYIIETTDRDPTHELLREDLAKSEVDLAAQRGSLNAAQQEISQMQSQLVSLDHALLDQKDLERDAKAQEESYLLYLGKREQERAASALDQFRIENVSIAEPPAMPALPVPRALPPVLLAFLLAAMFSLILTYTTAYLDPSFHGPSEVAGTLGIPFVIAIPKRAA
jgi:uncharacterized protein involved in exopolysaccharide biosynthesis